jgi:hypothetical protein
MIQSMFGGHRLTGWPNLVDPDLGDYTRQRLTLLMDSLSSLIDRKNVILLNLIRKHGLKQNHFPAVDRPHLLQ